MSVLCIQKAVLPSDKMDFIIPLKFYTHLFNVIPCVNFRSFDLTAGPVNINFSM